MEPERNIYEFEISIDAEFAAELRTLDVPEKQEGATEHIEGTVPHDMADVRFVGDSFLLQGITVGFQATGLDRHKEDLSRQRYATHNVDSPTEAVQVLSAFSRWEKLAAHLIEDLREEDDLRADGGTEMNGVGRLTDGGQFGGEACEECERFISPAVGHAPDCPKRNDDTGSAQNGGSPDA